MSPDEKAKPCKSSDDNLMAAVSHGSILASIFTLVGIFIPLIIWLNQKDKSEFVGFQAKQALIYQFAVLIVSAVLWLVGLFLTVILVGFLILLFAVLFDIVAVAYGIYAAYKTYKGEDFRYVWLGNWLQKQ